MTGGFASITLVVNPARGTQSEAAVMPSERLRRHLRVSLKTMMVLVVILAVPLAWGVNKAREQRRAVAAVQKYGGWVHYDYEFVGGKLTPGQEPWAPRWMRSLLGDEFFQEIAYVSLVYDSTGGKRREITNFAPCDDIFAQLAGQSGIKQLLLQRTQATDRGLEHVGRMTGLEALYIWDAASITDAGVAHLAGLKNLQKIHIDNSQITDQSLVLLSSLPKIEELSLQSGHFSDEGFLHLKGENTLKQLAAGRGDLQVTDAGLAHMKDFKKLVLLDLQNSKVTARGLEQLKGVPSLKVVWLSGTSITEDELKRFREAMPNVSVTK